MKKYRALGLPDFVADRVTLTKYIIESRAEAECSVLILKQSTPYRGEILVGAFPKDGGPYLCGLLELTEVCPVQGLPIESWRDVAQMPGVEQGRGFAWFFDNPRRIVEMPCKMKRGWSTIEFPEEEITEYPIELKLGPDGWSKILEKTK